jgi:hypothetical protein
MRFRCMISVVALTLSGLDARAVEQLRKSGHSRGSFATRALQTGAVYELRLRLPGNVLEEYLNLYTRWFLPVDQQPNSGRKLLSVLSRDQGDHYNIVFLYSYEEAYKHNYYCQYRKAFFDYHANDPDFLGFYKTAVKASTGGEATKDMLLATRDAIKADCTGPQVQDDLAEDTILQIDRPLLNMAELDEGNWNFGINLCKVAQISDAGNKGKDSGACPPSMLERAIDELEWPKKAPSPPPTR